MAFKPGEEQQTSGGHPPPGLPETVRQRARRLPPQPPAQPPKNRRWLYIVLLIAGTFASVIAGIWLGNSGQAGSSATAASGPSAASVSPALSPSPTTSAHSSRAPSSAPPSKGGAKALKPAAVLGTFTGSGGQTTARFTVPGSGNWELKWSYTCASYGSAGNFIVDEDGGKDLNGVNVNALGNGSDGITHAYGDTGRHYFVVNSECDWTMSAVSQP
jgi:hypothetical protein